MCQKVECRKCGKPTWAGCGGHIELVLHGIAEEDRCKCSRKKSKCAIL